MYPRTQSEIEKYTDYLARDEFIPSTTPQERRIITGTVILTGLLAASYIVSRRTR